MEQEPMPPGGRSQPIVPGQRSAWLEPIVILLLALALNLAGNGGTGLWDRDEPRYAVCVREMLPATTGCSQHSTASRGIISRSWFIG